MTAGFSRRAVRAGWGAAALLAAACGERSAVEQDKVTAPVRPPVKFPQATAASAESAGAMTSGKLELHEGCLTVGPDHWVIVWPATASLDAAAMPVTITDARNGAIIKVGDVVKVSGGEATRFRPGELTGPAPETCGTKIWVAGTVERGMSVEPLAPPPQSMDDPAPK